jgi:hypothetical protein
LDVLFCILFRYWPLGLDRAAEVRWLSTRRRLRIARRRPPRQPLLPGKLRCAGDRLELADTVEKRVCRSGAGTAAKFDLIERPLLNATRSGDGLDPQQNRVDQVLSSFSTE